MDEKQLSAVAEQNDFMYGMIKSANDIVYKFIIDNNFILYGGMALDLILKEKGHEGIYSNDALPDFDFYSPVSYDDSIILANILFAREFPYISSINAMHPTTRRTRVNFKEVADISYMPESIYRSIKGTIINHGQYKGVRVIDVLFIYMDFLRFFVYPFENAPLEPILNRLEKIVKRFSILLDICPIEVNEYIIDKSVKPLDSMSKRIGVASEFEGCPIIMTGILAYNEYYEYYKKHSSSDVKLFDEYKINDGQYEGPVIFPLAYFGSFINKLEKGKQYEMYNMFLETLQPKTVVIDGNEYLDLMNKEVVFTWSGNKMVMNIYGVMLYFLRKSFLYNEDKMKRDMCLYVYKSLEIMCKEMVKNTQIKDNIFIYRINVMGHTEYSYNENERKLRAELCGNEFESKLPMFAFYPGSSKYVEFDYLKSEKYAIDGGRII
jgi:hypothetical protein